MLCVTVQWCNAIVSELAEECLKVHCHQEMQKCMYVEGKGKNETYTKEEELNT